LSARQTRLLLVKKPQFPASSVKQGTRKNALQKGHTNDTLHSYREGITPHRIIRFYAAGNTVPRKTQTDASTIGGGRKTKETSLRGVYEEATHHSKYDG
jgi:hypothetical protein